MSVDLTMKTHFIKISGLRSDNAHVEWEVLSDCVSGSNSGDPNWQVSRRRSENTLVQMRNFLHRVSGSNIIDPNCQGSADPIGLLILTLGSVQVSTHEDRELTSSGHGNSPQPLEAATCSGTDNSFRTWGPVVNTCFSPAMLSEHGQKLNFSLRLN